MEYATLLVGWLLGLLSPRIDERIRRRYRRKELEKSLIAELRDLRYRMAVGAHQISVHQGLDTDELLDWLLQTVRAYEGPLSDPGHIEAIIKARNIPAENRRAAYKHLTGGRGLSLKEFHLPLLDATSSDLCICPLPFQRSVFRIAEELQLYNQRVKYLTKQFDLTFDSSVSAANHQAIVSNVEKGYKELASAARRIADLIGNLEDEFTR